MRAKRSLGQNFLVDPGLACALLDAAGIGRGSRVLEIGPGRGALTREILRRGADCVAVEKDDGLVRLLGALPGGLRLIHGDALEVDLTAPDLRGRVAVGNLPYNVALPILRRLLGVSPPFPRMALMFQREVAARLVAAPG
ncbi:MAG: 16S rRNA (adenine(1518)-N(6)/adenine(1519)-N(6))-dimethyltransferase, partial [Deltaproteobacteria bacterium]|nr:16S rRNA (adenine(1518)-N(6)/adenine(1519)-N(6))-dimethyltransferase [Deltaproteobacteria bacterium]